MAEERRAFHVIVSVGGWSIRRTGSSRASRTLKSRSGALGWALRRARRAGVPVYVHRRDGTVLRKLEP
jgi:hypothetical protein